MMCFLFHKWGKWRDLKMTISTPCKNFITGQPEKWVTRDVDGQTRACKWCGKRELRQV